MSEFFAEAHHPTILRLLDYWQSKRSGGLFPGRQDIDPLEFRYALGNVVLVDVLPGPRFRYRLFGSTLALRHGFDLTGRVIDEMSRSDYRDFILGLYQSLVTGRKPLFPAGSRVLDGRLRHYQAALFPLAADGTTIDMIFGYVVFIERGERA